MDKIQTRKLNKKIKMKKIKRNLSNYYTNIFIYIKYSIKENFLKEISNENLNDLIRKYF
jgi:hypothetical protein